MEKKRKQLTPAAKKALTKRTRDANIAEYEKREKTKIEKVETETKSLGMTPAEIRKKIRRGDSFHMPFPKGRPFLVLKDQEELLIEKDMEIVEEINKSYVEESKSRALNLVEKGDRGQKNLYFSNVKSCPREIYYKFFEPERARDYTVKGLILFSDGNMHHRNIQRRLEDRGRGRNPEGFLEIPECGAVGYYDILTREGHDENNWQICDMGEIKSKLPYACNTVSQVDYDQAQLYHYAAKKSKRLLTKRIKIRNIRIIYRDRAVETEEVHFGWLVMPDLNRQMQILQYLQWLHDVVVGKMKLVPHPYEQKSKNCLYCLFRGYCWRDYPGILEEEKEQVPSEFKIPDEQILDSYANELYRINKKKSELKKEEEKIAAVLMNYLLKTKQSVIRIPGLDEGFEIRKSKDTVWDKAFILKNFGADIFMQIADIKSSLVTALIKKEFIDAGLFEKAKKYKWKKPYLGLTKLGAK